MFRRPGPRFLLWVVVLVGVAAVAGVAHLAWWLIALIEFAAWALVAVVERSLSRPDHLSTLSTMTLPVATLPVVEDLSYVRVLGANAATLDPEPLAEPVLSPSDLWASPEPVPAPVLTSVAVAAVPSPDERSERKSGLISRPFRAVGGRAEPTVSRRGRTFGGRPVEWNVWNLERIAREQAGDDDELGFIVTYLRDYATPEGLLPSSFDSLVRESFGDLLGYATV